jgi:hypothetical protein
MASSHQQCVADHGFSVCKALLSFQMYLYYQYVYTPLQGCPVANETWVPRPPRTCPTAHRDEDVGLHSGEGACTSYASARCGRVPPGIDPLA